MKTAALHLPAERQKDKPCQKTEKQTLQTSKGLDGAHIHTRPTATVQRLCCKERQRHGARGKLGGSAL